MSHPVSSEHLKSVGTQYQALQSEGRAMKFDVRKYQQLKNVKICCWREKVKFFQKKIG